MSKRIQIGTAMLFVLIFANIAGISVISATASQPTEGGHLRIGYTIEARSPFNPIRLTSIWETYVAALVYDALIQTDADGNFIPLIAESWTISEDGKAITFNLRTDVKWHDGEPVTSADVRFTMETFIRESISFSANLAPLSVPDESTVTGLNVRDGSIETPDDYTVIFHLEEPAAPFFYYAGVTQLLAKHVLEGQELAFSDDYINEHVIGSGPFKYSEFVRGSHITLVVNEEYFQGRAYLDKLTFQIFKSSAAGEIALKAGDIDYFALVQPWDVESLETAGLNVQGQSVANVWYVTFNMNERLADGSYNPYSDIRVRRAIAHAIDITAMVESTYLGYGRVGTQPVPPEIKYFGESLYNEELPVPYYEYDVDKADELLDAAGYVWDPETGNASNGATYRLETTLRLWSGYDDIVKNSQFIQAQLQAVGINVILDIREWIAFLDSIFAPPQPKDWGVHMLGWTQNLDPDGIYSAKYYWSEVNSGTWGMNGGNYHNETFNQLVEKGRVTIDPVERSKIYQQLALILNEDIPELIYGYPDRIVSWNPDFKGFIFGLTGAGSVIAGAVSPYSLRQVYYEPTPEVPEFIEHTLLIAAIPILPLGIALHKKRNRSV